MSDHQRLAFLIGKRLILRPLLEKDFNIDYLSWLNDPDVNLYSQRRPFPSDWEEMTQYVENCRQTPKSCLVLAITLQDAGQHIGNISLVNIEPINHCANLAILIGAKEYWNRSYGQEAVYLLTKHAFDSLNLHLVYAGSFNPAFIKMVQKLGWKKDGEIRERIWSNGKYHNQVWLSQLRSDFELRLEFERD
jgi:RimJ/RimL family protein N-acetyltransferase